MVSDRRVVAERKRAEEAAAKSLQVAGARERQASFFRVRVLLVCMVVLLQRVWSGWPWRLEGPSLVRGQNRLSGVRKNPLDLDCQRSRLWSIALDNQRKRNRDLWTV
jgi:hypothetical protein